MQVANTATFVLVFLATLTWLSSADAQLFGSARQLGQPFQARRPQGGAAQRLTAEAGQVQGNERFLRSNRRRGDFVGSDRFERRSFVGSQQGTASGPVIPSTAGVRPQRDRSRQINRPLPPQPKNRIYYPRLTVGFENDLSGIRFAPELRRELVNPDHFSSSNRFGVSVVNRTATLRGVVASARERDLAELLVSFEPGISVVRNELRLPASDSAQESPRPPEPELEEVPPPPPAALD